MSIAGRGSTVFYPIQMKSTVRWGTFCVQYVDRDGQMATAFRQAGNAYEIQKKWGNF